MAALAVFGVLFLITKLEVVTSQNTRRALVPIYTWEDGVIPYEIPENSFDKQSRALIRVAMRRWEKQTCIRFVPLSESKKKEFYIKFYHSTTCFSDIGRSINQRPQLLGLSKGCLSIPVILHELGHALGMIHPMARNDRDLYIDVRIQNIRPGADRNFMTIRDRGKLYFTFGVPYDYESIMQYSPTIWSWNGNATMVSLQPEYQSILGNVDDVSFYDKIYIHRRYNCGRQCKTGYCENRGVVGGKSCQCICPDGYHGNYCEKRLPGANKIVNWRCRNGWTFRIGKCYKFLSRVTSLSWRQAQTFCQENGGSLPIISDQESFDVISDLVLENRELSTSKSYWLGLNYNKASEEYIWTDGNVLKHRQWLSRKENSEMPCAVFNGTDIINSGCGKQSDNGVFCTAPFDPSCGGRFLLHYTTDVTSPNYPNLHPPDITCQYVFKVSNNRKIQLTFKDFFLEYSQGCRNDFVEVQLNTDVSIPGKRYCGKQLMNQTLVSNGNFAIVTMRTNSEIQGRGFKLQASPVLVFRNSGSSQHFAFTRNIEIPLSFLRKLFENLPSRLGEG